MGKALTVLGMVIAVLIFCLFAVDLAIRMPFERASWSLDATLVICAAILGYLSWSAYKEQT
jgi:hypothetical protein